MTERSLRPARAAPDPAGSRVLARLLPLAVARATAPNGLRISERQLFYELCRLVAPAHRLPRATPFTVPVPLSYGLFRAALDRHGPIPGLLEPDTPRPVEPGGHTPEPDLFDYGLPRLLLCHSDRVARLLRANGLPLDSACPVLGAADLPLHPGLAGMLARVPGTVYVLHEASAAGLAFVSRARELAVLPAEVRVVPLGLRPRQAAGLHLFHRSGPATPPPGIPLDIPLDDRERRWLARGRLAELEAVRPAALLRTVHRLVREVRSPRVPLLELRRTRDAGFLTWPVA